MMISKMLIGLMGAAVAETNPDHGQFHHHTPLLNVQEYKNPSKKVTIHLIPHSHDDVGWKKTVEQYYDGTNTNVQWTNVRVELTTVINALLEKPDRKFSEVEMKFFSMWWDEQTPEMQEKVKGLVNNGQLELVNGGWSMHDEACPIYEDMVENMMIGHEFILNNFGKKPTIGW